MSEPTICLPGDIPGLLRRCSPFRRKSGVAGTVVEIRDGWSFRRKSGVAGTVVEIRDGSVLIVAWAARDGEARMDVLAPEDLPLDLTDATGRAHAAWWLALASRTVSTATMALAARWSPCTYVVACGSSWQLSTLQGGSATFGARLRWVDVPALADLQHDDLRILPDGSRWVDAEALRLVCLHVAGRAP